MNNKPSHRSVIVVQWLRVAMFKKDTRKIIILHQTSSVSMQWKINHQYVLGRLRLKIYGFCANLAQYRHLNGKRNNFRDNIFNPYVNMCIYRMFYYAIDRSLRPVSDGIYSNIFIVTCNIPRHVYDAFSAKLNLYTILGYFLYRTTNTSLHCHYISVCDIASPRITKTVC